MVSDSDGSFHALLLFFKNLLRELESRTSFPNEKLLKLCACGDIAGSDHSPIRLCLKHNEAETASETLVVPD